MSSVKERFEKVIGVQLEHAKEKALANTVFIVKDGETKEVECVKVENLPFGETTLGQYINGLTDALNELIDLVNSNQEATTKAINDLRLEAEKGTIL